MIKVYPHIGTMSTHVCWRLALTLWRPLLLYGYRCKLSYARPR